MKMPPKETPWGPWQKIQEIIPGVWLVHTASHGGYWLTPERLAEMPAVLREGPQTGSEKPFDLSEINAGWFEEDNEALRVVVAFARGSDKNAFPTKHVESRLEKFQREYPETWAELEAAGFFKAARKPAEFPVIRPNGTG